MPGRCGWARGEAPITSPQISQRKSRGEWGPCFLGLGNAGKESWGCWACSLCLTPRKQALQAQRGGEGERGVWGQTLIIPGGKANSQTKITRLCALSLKPQRPSVTWEGGGTRGAGPGREASSPNPAGTWHVRTPVSYQ